MNVTFDKINTEDAATVLGVNRTTVTYWCRNGLIRFTDLSDGVGKARYMFDADELDRINRLIEKYGSRAWTRHANEGLAIEANEPIKTEAIKPIIATTDPEEYIPDETDELVSTIKKIRALKIQRDKLLNEIDSIDEAIIKLKQKVVDAI